jgi:hypothetical protein
MLPTSKGHNNQHTSQQCSIQRTRRVLANGGKE